MTKARALLLAATAALLAAASARADDTIIVNGLPCNTYCQVYMGVAPQTPAAGPAAVERPRARPLPKRPPPAPRRAEVERDDSPPVPPRHGARPSKREASPPPCRNGAASQDGRCKPRRDAGVQKSPVVAAPVAKRPPAVAVVPGKAAEPPRTAAMTPQPAPGSAYNVLIVLASGVDTKLADLSRKTIVIAGPASLSRDAVAHALSAAGADAVTVSEGTKSDVDDLVKGGVSAAVVACLSPLKAQTFPAIAGFALFKVLVAKAEAACP